MSTASSQCVESTLGRGTWKELRTERESVNGATGNQFIRDSVGFNEFLGELGGPHTSLLPTPIVERTNTLSESSEKKRPLTAAIYTIETNA